MAFVTNRASSLRADAVKGLLAELAGAALDCDPRYGSAGNYAVADATAPLINHGSKNTKFLTLPAALNQRVRSKHLDHGLVQSLGPIDYHQ
jgi:hypothetical protein